MIYFDTSYLVRMYFQDPGFQAVRDLAATSPLACGAFGQVELTAAFHRKMREGSLSRSDYCTLRAEIDRDSASNAVRWIPLSDTILQRTQRVFNKLPPSVFLRAADALHLACAAEHGCPIVYSNDRHLLAAALHFGVESRNVIGQ